VAATESLLLAAGAVFAALAVGGALAARLDQSVIPAYIVAGVLVGPNAPTVAGQSLSLVQRSEFVTLLQELGVVLLLFFIGLEFDLGSLRRRRDAVVRAGGIDLLLNAGAGLALGLAFGFSAVEAVVLAGATYISSSAIITKSLIDLGWIADPEAEAVLGVLITEDLVIAVYLALLTALALSGGGLASAVGPLAVSVAVIGVLVALATVGTPLVERALAVRSDELFLLRILAAVTVIAGAALAFGVSEAVAAFFLGAAVGGTEHAGRVERVITSERDLYAAVFFFAIGLGTDPGALGAVAVPLVVLVLVTAGTKLVSGYLGAAAYGLTERRRVRMALALVARGEFSLVLAALAVTAGLDPRLSALIVGYVLVMSVLGTVLMRSAGRVERLVGRLRGGGSADPGTTGG
jgi:CPA2 family monovalent cation:H+ antiporter-2